MTYVNDSSADEQSQEHPNLRAAALNYAARNIPVFPIFEPTDGGCACGNAQCPNVGKHPRVKWHDEATTDEVQISEWWTRWPNANIGIPTGIKFIVLDVDDGPKGAAEIAQYPLPIGPKIRTGDGQHILFDPNGVVVPNRVKGRRTWPFQHCDLRGTGGYVVAPPSKHANGQRYRFIVDLDTLLPAMPDWLVTAIEQSQSHQSASTNGTAEGTGAETDGADLHGDAELYLAKYTRRVLVNGAGRNDTGWELACQLRDRGLSRAAAKPYLLRYQQAVAHAPSAGDKPPYTQDEAERTLASAYNDPARKRDPAPHGISGGTRPTLMSTTEWYLDAFGPTLRYVHKTRAWYEWNGRWWRPDEEQAPLRSASDLILWLYGEAARERDKDRRLSLLKGTLYLDSNISHVQAMIKVASSKSPISTRESAFDRDDWSVVAANGVIDLRTGRLLPHDKTRMDSRHLGPDETPLPFDPRATCPHWLEFLSTVLKGREDDIRFLQRAAGYSLTGDTSQQVWFLLAGDVDNPHNNGENGKSTLIRALKAVLGTYARTIDTRVLTTSSTHNNRVNSDIASLYNVRAVFAPEIEDGEKLSESRIKHLTGGDDITANHLYAADFNFRPKLKLWVHTNHKPQVRGQDHATWRRIRVLPFTHKITQPDKHFYERNLLPELPGILTWMVQGCLAWQLSGRLGEPESVTKALAGYREESDVLGRYLAENVFRSEEEGVFLRSSDLYGAYSYWCRQQGRKPEENNVVGKRVVEKFGVAVVVKRVAGTLARGYPGLTLEGNVVVS